ncbi:Dual specificity protein phosphatase 1B [Zea mays]|uniref:Dual specificity protein phosphatase 1B n=1 Tax=Zea mays TaxID=4577 RepID=A0A1D6KYI4_MAIZE|nr:Dual specificity protein phosphatase 1B [Zea mays]
MSMSKTGQAAEKDEQQQSRGIALMQGICAVVYRKADNTPCPIKQGLYLGSVGAAFNKDALKSLNITHILIVAKSLDPVFPAEFNYKKIEDEAISSGGNVLVHCFAGRSRSLTSLRLGGHNPNRRGRPTATSYVAVVRQVGDSRSLTRSFRNPCKWSRNGECNLCSTDNYTSVIIGAEGLICSEGVCVVRAS